MTTRKWRNEFLANTTTADTQHQSTIAALADGGFVIAWSHIGTFSDNVRSQRFDAAGVKVGGEDGHFVSIAAPVLSPAFVQLSDGNLWRVVQTDEDPSDYDILGIVTSLGGAFVRQQNGGALVPNNEVEPAVASLGSNGAIVVWQDQGSNGGDILMRGFKSDGSPLIAPTTVNGGATLASNQSEAGIAANKVGTRFAVVWRDSFFSSGDIRARVFDDSGAEVMAEFTVNFIGDDAQSDPAVAWLDNQKFAVAWTTETITNNHQDGSGTAVKFAVFTTAPGNPVILGERLATVTTAGDQSAPAITSLANGGFVIAWVDGSASGGDQTGFAIRLQTFNSAGERRGDEILVNTTTAGSQTDVSLTTLADGRVLVSWTDDSATGGDTSGSAVRAQIVDPRDGVIDGTGGADTLYGHDSVGDIMSGYAGVDIINGLAGNDQIQGGDGGDTLNGGRGDDTLFGGTGNDTLHADLGDDEQYMVSSETTICAAALAPTFSMAVMTSTPRISAASRQPSQSRSTVRS